MNSTSGSKRRKKEKDLKVRGGLALGYEVLEIRDEGDEGMFNSPSDSREEGGKRSKRGRRADERIRTPIINLLSPFVTFEFHETCTYSSTAQSSQRTYCGCGMY
jgi:hypothetical protein